MYDRRKMGKGGYLIKKKDSMSCWGGGKPTTYCRFDRKGMGSSLGEYTQAQKLSTSRGRSNLIGDTQKGKASSFKGDALKPLEDSGNTR